MNLRRSWCNGVLSGMDEQDVRLHCCGFDFVIRIMQYDVVIPLSCAVEIYHDGDGGFALIRMERCCVGRGQTGRTFVYMCVIEIEGTVRWGMRCQSQAHVLSKCTTMEPCCVGSAQSACMFVLLRCIWISIEGDYKVFDAVQGVLLILMCCPKYTTMAMTTIWSSLNVWHGGVVAVDSICTISMCVSLLVLLRVQIWSVWWDTVCMRS